MELNESEIVRQSQSGDWSNFDQLYAAYLPRIYGFVFNRVRHKQTAEDLTAQVFYKVVDHLGSFRADQGGFQAWVYRIARNQVIDHYRVSKPTADLETAAEPQVGDDFVEQIDLGMNAAALKRQLKQLSEQQREVVMLRVWDDLSHAEIAAVLNISEANSKVIFSRAVARLRQLVSVVSLFAALIGLTP